MRTGGLFALLMLAGACGGNGPPTRFPTSCGPVEYRAEPGEGTIGAALERAERVGACGVIVRLSAGEYHEGTLSMTRHTALIGDGIGANSDREIFANVHSNGPHVVTLARLTLNGDLFASHQDALTVAQSVSIRKSQRWGIHVQRGTLIVIDGELVGVTAPADSGTAAVGLLIRRGAKAALWGVHIHDNDLGIYISGAGSQLFASAVVVESHGRGPVVRRTLQSAFGAESSSWKEALQRRSRAAAVRVDGAGIYSLFDGGTAMTIRRNGSIGLALRGGAIANMEGVIITHTSRVDGDPFEWPANLFIDESRAVLDRLRTEHAGMGVAAFDSQLIARELGLAHLRYGLVYGDLEEPGLRCVSPSEIVNVDQRLVGDQLVVPVPDGDDLDDLLEPRPAADCPTIERPRFQTPME